MYQEDEIFGNDIVGLKSLAGSGQVFIEPSATYLLSMARLAEQAAVFIVTKEATEDVSSRTFFVEVSVEERLDTDLDASTKMIQRWHLVLFGHDVEGEGDELKANIDLWNALYNIHDDPTEAWTGLLSALMRDPDFVMY